MRKKSASIAIIVILIISVTYIIYNIHIRRNITKISSENINQKERMISDDLRIGITNFDTINPIISNNTYVQYISRLIFEPLINLSYDFRLEQCLANEWSKINNKEYIIKLRENVKWQDGKKFDSDDVIFTVNIIKKLKESSVYFYNVKDIKEIKKIDNYTIRIITYDEIPYFEYNLIFPIMSSKYYSEENFTKENKNISPIGTGMYYIEEKPKGDIELKRNTDWWQKKELRINNININLYKDINEELTGIESNKIDLLVTSSINIDKYINTTRYNKKIFVGRNYSYLTINCNNYLLKNKKLRQTINYGINKSEIIEKVYNNNYIKSEFPLDFGSYVYKGSADITYYDINKAKKLLRENEIKNEKIIFLVNSDNKDKIEVADLIKNQLKEINIEIEIIKKNKKEYEKDLANKNYNISLVENTYSFSPTLNSYFEEDNLSNYNSIKIRKLLSKIENISEEEVIKKIEDIKEIYDKDVPYISLFYNTNTLVYSKNLKGEISPNSYNIFYNIENWFMEYDK